MRSFYGTEQEALPVPVITQGLVSISAKVCINRPFSHCLCACVYRSRGALCLDNRRDFTEMGQTDFKPLILSM